MPVPVMPSSLAGIARFPRARLGHTPTPLDPAPNLGGALGIDLWIKRDDCTGLAFGGNKVRQIEFHFGEAEARGADTVLVTGAVQSNLVRIAAASARRLGMEACILAPIANVPVRFSGPRTPPPHRLRRDLAVRVPEPHVGTGTRRRKRVERNRACAIGPGAGGRARRPAGRAGVSSPKGNLAAAEAEVTLALCQRPVSKLHITNILMRLIEEPRPAPLPPPLALKLVNEPLANTQHYDRLREKSHTD